MKTTKLIIACLILALVPAMLFALKTTTTTNVSTFAELQAAAELYRTCSDITINIEDNIEMTHRVTFNIEGGNTWTINGNNKKIYTSASNTLTGNSDNNSTYSLLKFNYSTNNSKAKEVVEINDLTVEVGDYFRFGIELYNNNQDANAIVTFENTSIITKADRKAYEKDDVSKTGAPLLNNGLNVVLKGNCTFAADEYCYSAIDVTGFYKRATLEFDTSSHVVIEDNRNPENKMYEPLVKTEESDYADPDDGDYEVIGAEVANLVGFEFVKGSGYAYHKFNVQAVKNQLIAKCIDENCYYHDNPLALTLVKASKQLSATVSPEDAINKNVEWSSSDSKIATVDETGLVTVKGTTLTTSTELTINR